MSADLHERIAAAVAEERSRIEYDRDAQDGRAWAALMDHRVAACDHADKVLARHYQAPSEAWGRWSVPCRRCRGAWPCPEVRDLADLWLGEGWDQ